MGQKKLTIGVDLGGTNVDVALVDLQGRVLSSIRYPTNPNGGPNGIIEGLVSAINKIQSNASQKADAVGIGSAGQIDRDGVIRSSPNLPFDDFPIKEKLESELGMPVFVTNDVNAAAFGEWKFGAGKGVDDLVVIFVGTGIGGGVISKGRLLEGCDNTAGELGHVTIVAGGRKCHCPNSGCLEAYAGGWAIARRAQEEASASPDEAIALISLAGGIKNITAATVGHAYANGDAFSKKLVEETGQYLGAGVVGILNAFNPCTLVLGGGVVEGIPDLIQIVEGVARKRALKTSIEKLKIKKTDLGTGAGPIGAAALCRVKIGGE